MTRFASSRDGRQWGHREKNRRSGFDGDRYLAKCKGFFQCLNSECPYITQYNACNTVQFTSAGKYRCCNKMAVNNAVVVERVPCQGRKIWEFAVNSNKVIVKHYGQHTCTSKKVIPLTTT